jgi:curved DNA-binding protein CbpA
MGNDNSKSTIENQQLIMQLQQQILNQQQTQQAQQAQQSQQPPQQSYTQQPLNNQNQFNQSSHSRPTINTNHTNSNSNTNDIYNRQLPVISPAELSNNIRNNRPLHQSQYYDQVLPETSKTSGTVNLLSILGNKELMKEIDKNPQQKRKLLEKILNEHRHTMTTTQVTRINQILSTLPPLENYTNTQTNKTLHNYSNTNIHSINNQGLNQGFNQGTTSQDHTSRELQTRTQLNTIDALTKHYKTEAEEEEARFKLEEEKRKSDFADKQRQRRLHYQSSLSDLEKANIDSLKLFNLDINYTIDDLKSAYKRLAMKTHPDKPGGNVEQFQLVTKCYMSLLEKYKNRETDKNFNDLRVGSKTYIEDQNKYNTTTTTNTNNTTNTKQKSRSNTNLPTVEKERFDVKIFNKIYEQNKLWESGDDGYGDWFQSEEADPPTEVFGKKFNLNVFNSTFEDYKDKVTSENGAIQESKDPLELVSCSTGFTDIDIYARKINEFSKALPTGKSKNDLAYTDLKTAYTSKGAFIDPNKVEYKQYKSVDDLKRDRSNVRYDMTPDQMKDYELKKRREIEEEEARQDLIRQRDNVISKSFSKNHERMLGYKGNASY